MLQVKAFAHTNLDDLEREFNDWAASAGVTINETKFAMAYDIPNNEMVFSLVVLFTA